LLFRVSIPVIDRVCFINDNYNTCTKIDSIDFQILAEADFLVSISKIVWEERQQKAICACIFKTEAGKSLLRIMYFD
jgi:uncharacterized protein